MATVTQKAMYRGAAATSSTTLYTVSSTSAVATVTNIVITNTSASTSATATISIDGTVIIPAVSVLPSSVATFDIKQVIPANNPAKTVTGFASATTVNFHISGVEVA